MQSSNPALGAINRTAGQINFGGLEQAATMAGTTTKSILLVAITLVVGSFAMSYSIESIFAGQVPSTLIYGSCIAAFIVALITIFKPNVSPITSWIYAVFEGLALGSLSGLFEFKYPGIVSTAVLSTFSVVFIMLFLWKFRIVVPTAKFRSVMVGAITGVFFLYLIDIVFSLFGASLLPTSGPLSILISLVVCTIAAFSLILDFDNIETCVNEGLPKYFEYYNAFSLLVTICWLYVEILRLLSKRE